MNEPFKKLLVAVSKTLPSSFYCGGQLWGGWLNPYAYSTREWVQTHTQIIHIIYFPSWKRVLTLGLEEFTHKMETSSSKLGVRTGFQGVHGEGGLIRNKQNTTAATEIWDQNPTSEHISPVVHPKYGTSQWLDTQPNVDTPVTPALLLPRVQHLRQPMVSPGTIGAISSLSLSHTANPFLLRFLW